MGGNNKNIRSRKAIRKALQTIHQPFTINDLAYLCGYGIIRVGALLPSIEGVTKEAGRMRNNRCVWWYDPEDTDNE